MRSDALLATMPPHDLEAERITIAAPTLDPLGYDAAAEYVAPDGSDFYRPAHAEIWRVETHLRARGAPIEAATIVSELRERQQLENVGGPAAVAEILSSASTAANAAYYAARVAEKALLRRTVIALAKAQEYVTESSDPTVERLDAVERIVFEATRLRARRGEGATLDSMLAEVFAEAEKIKNGTPPGLLTGIHGFDRLTLGLRRGDLAIVAARPGAGKSTLLLNILRNVALPRAGSAGLPVALFSFEMSGREIVRNLLALLARVDSLRFRGGSASLAEEERLVSAGEVLSAASSHLEIIGAERAAGFTVTDIRSRARRLKAEGRLELLAIDYLQLARATRRDRSREQEVAEVSRDLRSLAAELEVPVLALAQLNRNVEDRPDRRPRLADLRESGQVEQDASLVALLHRPAVFMTPEQAASEGLSNFAEIIIAKSRYGPSGDSVPLFFDRTTGYFADGERPSGGRSLSRDGAAAAAGDA